MKRFLIALLLAVSVAANAQPKIIQVTVGASTTRLSTVLVSCRWIVIQNNAANTMHIGDATASSTAGIKLLATGSFYQGPLPAGVLPILPTGMYLERRTMSLT